MDGARPTVDTKDATRNPMNWTFQLGTGKTWALLCSDSLCGSWGKAAKTLATYLEGTQIFHYGAGLHRLSEQKLSMYTGDKRHYNSVHLLRCIRFGVGKPAADSVMCWCVLIVMGAGPRTACTHVFGSLNGSLTYNAACSLRNTIRKRTGLQSYHLDDMICLICLCKKQLV